MIRNLQVLAIALLGSSVSLAFGQVEVDDAKDSKAGKSVVGDDGAKGKASAAPAKIKPGKDKKVYVGKSHEAGKPAAVDAAPEKGVRRSFWQRLTGRNSAGEDKPDTKKKN